MCAWTHTRAWTSVPSWQLSPRFEAYLAIDNLTDQEYEEFVGFEARGIAPRAGVRFSL